MAAALEVAEQIALLSFRQRLQLILGHQREGHNLAFFDLACADVINGQLYNPVPDLPSRYEPQISH